MTLATALASQVATCTKGLAVAPTPLSSRTHRQQVGRVSPIAMDFQVLTETTSKYTRSLQ